MMATRFLGMLITVSILATFSAQSENPDSYPLSTCVVSGKPLGSHGPAFVYLHQEREIHFCCKACLKDFLKNPAPYLNILDDAAARTTNAPAASGTPAAQGPTTNETDTSHAHE